MSRLQMCLMLPFIFAVLTAGQQDSAAQKQAGSVDSPISGKRLYSSYCAMCHGVDAKGGGPFSTQLKAWPPDLTQLSSKNGGVYPAMHVAEVIDGEFEKSAHGSKDMPVWGPVFRSMAHGKRDSASRRIDNLVKYLESVQTK